MVTKQHIVLGTVQSLFYDVCFHFQWIFYDLYFYFSKCLNNLIKKSLRQVIALNPNFHSFFLSIHIESILWQLSRFPNDLLARDFIIIFMPLESFYNGFDITNLGIVVLSNFGQARQPKCLSMRIFLKPNLFSLFLIKMTIPLIA